MHARCHRYGVGQTVKCVNIKQFIVVTDSIFSQKKTVTNKTITEEPQQQPKKVNYMRLGMSVSACIYNV